VQRRCVSEVGGGRGDVQFGAQPHPDAGLNAGQLAAHDGMLPWELAGDGTNAKAKTATATKAKIALRAMILSETSRTVRCCVQTIDSL
jgi:hypothetical protein